MLLLMQIITVLYIIFGVVLIVGWYVSAEYFEKVYNLFGFFFTPFVCIPSLAFAIMLLVGYNTLPYDKFLVMLAFPSMYVAFLTGALLMYGLIDLLARGKTYFEEKRGRK